MTVSVKIREETKRRLEALQAKIASRFNYDLSFQELLDAVTTVSESDPVLVLGVVSRVKLPLSEAAKKRILEFAMDLGPTSEDDIAQVLYSDEAIHGRATAAPRARR